MEQVKNTKEKLPLKKQEQKIKQMLYNVILILIGMAVNYGGRRFAECCVLPFWLDSIGTGIIACLAGPFWGAVCGGLTNLFCGIRSTFSIVYSIVNIAIGLILGISYRRGAFEHIFNAMTVSVMVAIVVTVLSTPLNLIFLGGYPGNPWGNAMVDMLTNYGMHLIPASFFGELFVDFPDKIVMVLSTFLVAKFLFLKLGTKEGKYTEKRIGFFVLLFLGSLLVGKSVQAKESQNLPVSGGNPASVFYTQTVYSSAEGLTAGEANTIVATPDGYLWIGTYAGLYRYDGHNFRLMQFDSVKNVNKLYVDKEGRLWIGTNDKGISIYKDGSIMKVIDKTEGLPSNSVRCIGEDPQGDFYIGTASSMCIIAKDDFSIQQVMDEVVYANNISINSKGLVSVVTNAGELFFMKDRKIQGRFQSDTNAAFISSTFTSEDKLYLGTSENIVYPWKMDEEKADVKNKIQTGKLAYIHSMTEDDVGNIWICSDNGIGYIRKGRFHEMNTKSFDSSVDTMLKDYQGNLWFTSSRLGLLKLAENSFYDLYTQSGCDPKVVNSVVIWQGLLYSGTDTGLDILDLKNNKPYFNKLTKRLEGNRIRCLMVDSQNNLWISTSVGIGLIKVTPKGEMTIFCPANGSIGERFRSTIELSDGTIVAAENTGIDFIKNDTVVATLGENDGLSNPQILSMVQMDEDTIYAGSDGDGIMVIRGRKVVDKIDEENGLPSGVILRMVQIDNGLLIVTSNSLCYMDEDEKITELKNFPYSNNYDVIESEDGKLWVLGSAGIYIVKKESLLLGNMLQYELLDSQKGLNTSLTANSWNYVDGSTLYFAGNSGAYCIDMSHYVVYSKNYLMMAEYLNADGTAKTLAESEATVVAADSSRITIRPELLNYTLNDPYISYYLEGIDEKAYLMLQSSLEDISYTNIPAGDYIFHLSVLDNTGTVVMESQSYPIKKQPQFWEHRWFIFYVFTVCAMGVAYVTWLFAVLRSNKIIEKQKQEIVITRRQAEMGNETILAIAKAVDAKDENTSQHSLRVSQYSVMLAKRLGWTKERCENLRQIALLHDIGKIGIADSILNKPSKLTEEEYGIMKTHVDIGAKILKDFTLVENVTDGVRYHHEKYDGTGYMQGLKGEEIPLDARIIGIADAFDAMTSNRIYRKRQDLDYVIKELKRCRGGQFDPQLTDIFLEMIEDGSVTKFLSSSGN